jgi:4-hydroxybenzoyl-CoA reductase subunit alpha
MSRRTGRPVRIVLNRKDELAYGRRRHGMKIKSKVAFEKDGTIIAKDFEAFLDGGAYNSMGPTATFLCGNFGAMLYRYPIYRYRGYHVYTNLPPSGAMRGFGAPQALFISETQMNMAAIDLGIDAIDLRLKNAMVTGDQIEGVTTISSAGFVESLEKVASMTKWKDKKKNLPKNKGIGIGCYSFISGGVFNWFNTQYNFSACEVRVYDDGTAHLLTMSADIGQGSDTVLRQILAADLGLPVEKIRLTAGDTAMTPKGDLGTWGSRVTLMNGNAILDASKKIKDQLAKIISLKYDLNVIHEVDFGEERVFTKVKPDRGVSFGEAVRMWVKLNRGEELTARGHYTPRDKGLTTPAYSFGAQIAEVEVDPDTGVVTVEKITTAHDCGTVINPLSVEGQLEGAIQMGLGYTLSEQFAMRDGETLNTTFLDYKVPAAEDMPEIVSAEVHTFEPEGPYGAKEVGEGLVIPTAPAIADAVFQATGYRCKDLPITPEKILRGTGKM